MSTPFNPNILTRRCDEDLSSSEWSLVKPTAGVDDDIAPATAGDLCIGALTNDVADGSSTAVYVPVQIGGIIKVKCGAAIAAGVLAASDANGEAVTAVDQDYAFGLSLEDLEDNEVGAFLWAPSFIGTLS